VLKFGGNKKTAMAVKVREHLTAAVGTNPITYVPRQTPIITATSSIPHLSSFIHACFLAGLFMCVALFLCGRNGAFSLDLNFRLVGDGRDFICRPRGLF